MTERDIRRKTGTRAPAERPHAVARPAAVRPRTGHRHEHDPAQQAEEVRRTFSDRWEW